jgi:hypothetical protein
MLILRVGDAHVQVSNLDDCEKLLAFILATAKKQKVDRIEFLGDQHHTHAIKRVEVERFWDKWFTKLSLDFETVVLLGNHEMANQRDPNSENGLEVYKDINNRNLKIVTEPTQIGNIGYMPYIHDSKEFVDAANSLKTKLLVCHFTCDGSMYENGFYAPDGVDANLLNHEQVISGHIHMEAQYGKVWYPGSPKWDTASDANMAKQIWLCEHDDKTGLMTSKTAISTWGVVTPIVSFQWLEGQEQPVIPDNVKASVEIIGSNLFVSKGKAIFKGIAKIKTKVTDKVVRENRKASASVLDFLEKNYKTSVNRDKLVAYLKEKNYV